MNKVSGLLSAALLLLLPAWADAQPPVRRVKVDNNGVRVGFQRGLPTSNVEGFKAGMWTPVFVRLVDDETGDIFLLAEKDGSITGELLVETTDNDGTANIFTQPFTIAPGEPLQLITYTKVANTRPMLKISLRASGKTYQVSEAGRYFQGVDLGQHLYLTLGDILNDFHAGLVKMAVEQKNNVVNPGGERTMPRFAFYENNAQNLPSHWFGYGAVDLIILVTNNGKFIDKLTGERQAAPQLDALAEWVRRGGRLVVSITPANREKVFRLLTAPAWQPALPQVLTVESKTVQLESLHDLSTWSAALDMPFRPKFDNEGNAQARHGVRLQPSPLVSVLCSEPDGKDSVPLIVRFPCGTGSITLLAFDVKDGFFTEWPGQPKFWQAVVEKLAPLSKGDVGPQFGNGLTSDVATQLYDTLEKFDTPTISYGWIVLLILLYIIVVGPVDYILLKVVFKRLELTWITFPAVVLTVSVLAYFTAYAIKGQDLKVNKVDLIDIDLRSSLGRDLQPAGARIYGTTWFTILSPRIQNYTIGIEPVPHKWREGAAAPVTPIEPTLSWLGRPEFGGMGAAGRSRSPSLFSRSYFYQGSATGLTGVPITVWTTRSFTASWETPLDKTQLPFEAALTYEVGKRRSLSGTLKSNLPFDLYEVFLVHGDKFYPVANVPKGSEVKLQFNADKEFPLTTWVDARGAGEPPPDAEGVQGMAAFFQPSLALRDLMFHEKVGHSLQVRNHNFRALDWSWRCEPDWRPGAEGEQGDVKEVILVARLARARGTLDQLQSGNDPRLPTHLWLGELPGTPVAGKTRKVTRPDGQVEELPVFEPRPATPGSLIQETFIRVILPVAPRK